MIENKGIVERFRRYFLWGTITFLLLITWSLFMNPDRLPPAPVIVLLYLSTIAYSTSSLIATRMNLRTLFTFIFLFQLFSSLFLREFFLNVTGDELGFLENIVDSGTYREDAFITRHLTFSQTIEFLSSNISLDISDYGFPIILRIAYIIGGDKYGNFVMMLFNVVFHTASTLLLYKTCQKFLRNELCKIIAILWGFNLISIWINVSGLKETVFLFFILFTTYHLYGFYTKKSIYHLSIFLIGVFIVALFRIYLSVFFISILLLTFFPKTFYAKYTPLIWAIIIIVIINFITVFSYFFPVLQYVYDIGQTRNETSGIRGIISIIFPVIGPFPAFLVSQSENSNLNTFFFSAFSFIKMVFSIFGIYGIYYIVKKKVTDIYPMVTFFILNTLLVVITGFELHYRFIYCALPLFIVITIYGLNQYVQANKKIYRQIFPIFLIFCTLVAYLYNCR